MSDVYRDALLALRARVQELTAAVKARGRRLPATLLERLPATLAARLRDTRPAEGFSGETVEELTRRAEQLSAHLDALHEAIALAPQIDEAWQQPAATAPEPRILGRAVDMLSGRTNPEAAQALHDQLQQLVWRHDPAAEVTRASPQELRVRFSAEGAPFALALRHLEQPLQYMVVPTTYRLALTTSVARAVPGLRLVPELLRHMLVLKPLHLVRDLSVDDPSFDGMFIIECAEVAGARLLLDAPVRAALLQIARFDIPTLTVEDGGAQIAWCHEPTAQALDAAVRALTLVRRAPAPSLLDRDPSR